MIKCDLCHDGSVVQGRDISISAQGERFLCRNCTVKVVNAVIARMLRLVDADHKKG